MPLVHCLSRGWLVVAGVLLLPGAGFAQGTLEAELKSAGAEKIAAEAKVKGNAARGAIVFFQPYLACSKCHVAPDGTTPLGPNLATVDAKSSDVHLVESILDPSKAIRKGYETVIAVRDDGTVATGRLEKETATELRLLDAGGSGKSILLKKNELDEVARPKQSMMPAGQVNILTSRQQFLDLVKYLMEIRDGGAKRALELQPPPSLYAARPVPEYEQRVDHAGMLGDLNRDSFKRGAEIYNRLCINCHGTHDKPGSLPTALRFASGKFKNGNDPHSMYRTLTYGYGMMVPQTWMVPQQKYDVIHYIRETYLRNDNPSQYAKIDNGYLARLPKGDTRGPAPVKYEPWVNMDYGPSLINTYEFGKEGSNFAYKGIAVRLDSGPGGMSRGRYWMAIDHDTMRMAGAWSGDGFVDWNGIHFNGRHNIHPRVKGTVHVSNPSGPGWANPHDGSFSEVRVQGRDDRFYGPLPRNWAHYKGLYHDTDRTVISYTVGNTSILEMPGVITTGPEPVFTRAMNIGPRSQDLVLQLANHSAGRAAFYEAIANERTGSAFVLSDANRGGKTSAAATKTFRFEGGTHLVGSANRLNLDDESYTVTARIRTKSDGTIFSVAPAAGEWVPDAKALFIRGGRLTTDIGWVGAVRGKSRVNNGRWTNVAMVWDADSAEMSLYVNGKPNGSGELAPKKKTRGHVVKLGFASPNFPNPSAFNGEMESVRFYQTALSSAAIKELAATNNNAPVQPSNLMAEWKPGQVKNGQLTNTASAEAQKTLVLKVASGNAPNRNSESSDLMVVTNVPVERTDFQYADNNLRLRIPAGDDPLRLTIGFATAPASDEDVAQESLSAATDAVVGSATPDLTAFTKGGPPRWPQKLTTKKTIGTNDGPYTVDVLARPADNPWLAQVRLTGFDFYPDGNSAAVCAWDGDVWLVTGLKDGSEELTWQRIASGLFQPLGLKIVQGKIHVTCRDQLCILHDLNGDGETDYYENFNNDHQVTEHFHEFAMGLQTDDAGNFYYAKSARHALKAIVPHHGTLLKISPDGETTKILANGFRAANGVCLNPDGTFIVTDQEGHWNPKNRINYVKEGGFYGNMFGYHDVTNSADDAMEQPLCWITNAFDRSPGELLWADTDKWGPLGGMLLNLSYGYGKVYVVPHEKLDGHAQGGMCQLPIPQFPTGVMRGRFSPVDGQLYCCGMFAWAGSQHQPGGFYRVRYTGKPVHLPAKLQARKKSMTVVFTDRLDPRSVTSDRFAVKVWSLKRTANYGSKHYDEHPLEITGAHLEADGRTVVLDIPNIAPTWCMEIKYRLTGMGGEPVNGTVHNTIHRLGDGDDGE